jgi:ribosomal protein S1
VVSVGQTVEVIVLSIDAEKRRLSLSMAAAAQQAEANDLAEARASVVPAPARLGTLADLFNKKR